jgi:hypothetical protein
MHGVSSWSFSAPLRLCAGRSLGTVLVAAGRAVFFAVHFFLVARWCRPVLSAHEDRFATEANQENAVPIRIGIVGFVPFCSPSSSAGQNCGIPLTIIPLPSLLPMPSFSI